MPSLGISVSPRNMPPPTPTSYLLIIPFWPQPHWEEAARPLIPNNAKTWAKGSYFPPSSLSILITILTLLYKSTSFFKVHTINFTLQHPSLLSLSHLPENPLQSYPPPECRNHSRQFQYWYSTSQSLSFLISFNHSNLQ